LTFSQQVDRLIELGYPALAGLAEEDFTTRVAPLAPLADHVADQVADQVDGGLGRVPFILVVTRQVVDPYASSHCSRSSRATSPASWIATTPRAI
jgi:hypothetical protein